MHQVSPLVAGEDLATIMLRIGELTAVVDMSWVSIPTREVEQFVSWGEYRVEGAVGTLHLGRDGLLRLITDRGEKRYQFPADSEQQGYQTAQQHFVDCLRSDAKSETSGSETLKAMELVFGAYESAIRNQVYRVGHDLAKLR